MSLDGMQSAPKFSEYSIRATKRFLKSAVVIDDEIISEPTTMPVWEKLAAPPFATTEEKVTRAAESEHDTSKDAEVLIKPLADAFLDKQIVCGVLKPEPDDEDSEIIKRAVHAAAVADIVILDWYLRKTDDKLAKTILKEILRADQGLNGRLRLVLVYTSADPLTSRRDELAEHLRQSKLDVQVCPHDDRLLTVDSCRVRFVRKKSFKEGVAVQDLPEIAIDEFAKHSNGLLANFALLGIAALRDATHHILANLDGHMDSAFVGHRMLLGNSDDAHEFAMNLFMLQMKGVLTLPKHLGGSLKDDELLAWFDGRFDYPNVDEQLDDIGVTKEALRESLQEGTGKLDVAHKALFLPECKDAPSRVEEIEKQSSKNFARFATFVREPKGFNLLPTAWVPTLTLGSVVKLVGASSQYFLCVQPACDSVRIDGERYFPFIELVTQKPSKSKENLALRDGDDHVVVSVNTKPGSRHYAKFSADGTAMAVRAKSQGEHFTFLSKSEHYYWWLGDIDPLKAQRIATDFSGTLARVGIDEYEWLRRGGSAK